METQAMFKAFARAFAVAALVGGCSDGGKTGDVACSADSPPAAEALEIVPAWAGRTNSVLTLKASFAKTGAARTIWDIPLACDLRARPGIQFDFWCDDLRPFTSFSCYFKSGRGWYHGTFSPEDAGKWQRVTVRKAETRVEGVPDGWGDITHLRISGWRGEPIDATCRIANVAYLGGGKTDIAIVYAGSMAAKGGAEGKAYMAFAANMSATLEALGVASSLIADADMTTNDLANVSAVMLPYNTSFPAATFPALKWFVESGRKIFACYSMPSEVAGLFGLRQKGVIRPARPIAGFLKRGAGLAGQPEFAPQASWMTQRVDLPPFGAETVAVWAAGDRSSLDIPALVRTPAGIYMAHVWLGGAIGDNAALMRAIVCDLAPSLKAKIEAREADAAKRDAEDRAWLAAQKPREGEHRAFWCHSAYGLGGGKTWEESARFLKENGFNVLIPNLAWGGTAFYRSAVLPVAAEVATQGDALEQCLAACRKHGVQCHVWKVCWNMGSCADPAFAAKMAATNRTQVTYGGASKPGWLCPSHPDNQRQEIEAMVELARKGVDGVHFDYIRYPDGSHCFCAGCRARFEAMAGGAVTNWPAAVRKDERLGKLWHDFRTSNITYVVREVSRRVRAEAPGVKVSAAVFSSAETAPSNVGQDWPAWCREGLLDFVCPMDYVESSALFRGQVVPQKRIVGKVPVYPGIGLSTWRNDGRDAVRLAKQILVVRELGLDGFTVFNLDRRAEKALPLLRLGVTR
ncbi:MAG: family 10 glycosylhydrolase [Kiritimatiellae bacterium]|nr:family 10 glycosylhydrolase [Kiritimatiellia bacterium]